MGVAAMVGKELEVGLSYPHISLNSYNPSAVKMESSGSTANLLAHFTSPCLKFRPAPQTDLDLPPIYKYVHRERERERESSSLLLNAPLS